MFCGKCGVQIKEGAKFCQKCGSVVSDDEAFKQTEYRSETPPQTIYQPVRQVVHQPVYQPQSRPYFPPGTHPYHNLGGFLMFQVVVSYIGGVSSLISIITTFFTYGGILNNYGDWLPGNFKGLLVFTMIGSALLYLITACVLFSYASQIQHKDPNVLHFIQSASVSMFVVSCTFYLIVFIWLKQTLKNYYYFDAISTGTIISYLIIMGIVWLIGLIIGSVYFGSSVRVRTYMGSDAYLKNSLFNKGTIPPIPADGSDQFPDGYGANNSAGSNHTWRCTGCGKMISQDICPYCGKKSDVPWTCPKCGETNASTTMRCVSCEALRPLKEKEPPQNEGVWTCPNCMRVNSMYIKKCMCGTPIENRIPVSSNRRKAVEYDEWLCPNCHRVNKNYVGACGCGQIKP